VKKSFALSEEMINAFIDDELEAEERDWIIEMAIINPELDYTIKQAHKLKALVKASKCTIFYNAHYSHHNKKKYHLKYYAVASIMVLITSLFFILNMDIPTTQHSYISKTDTTLLMEKDIKNTPNLVLHMNSLEGEKADKLFQLLNSTLHTPKNKNIQIEVILSGLGLQILRSGKSSYIDKIKMIKHKYNNVTFIACGKTLDNLKNHSSKKIQITKEAMLVSSGPNWARKRQQQGWTTLFI